MTYPTYPTHPSYPPNSRNNPWRSYEQAAANAEPTPEPKPLQGLWTGRYGLVFAVVVTSVTIAALVLAFLGTGLAPRVAGPASSGLTRVFDGALTNNGQWENTDSCYFSSSGLDVSSRSGAAQCQYKPSINTDFTSQGFLLEVTVAPAASIQGQEIADIAAAGTTVEVTQQGAFTICTAADVPCTLGTPSSAGSTDAWHTDGYVSNTIAVRYSPNEARLTVIVNGQQIASLPTGQISGPIALGTRAGGEALYTHAALYSASGS